MMSGPQYSHGLDSCQPANEETVDVLDRIAQWLWPPVCVLCRRGSLRSIDLCANCEADLPLNDAACVRCALPLPASSAHPQTCGRCLRRPPRFSSAYAPFLYGYPLDRMIQRFKYHGDAASGRVLGDLLGRKVRRRLGAAPPDAMIPAPLSTRRFRERGFNQACELALRIRAITGIALRPDLVVRRRDTPEQSGLKRAARRKNLRGAFAATQPLPGRIAIVDDVITTGSTADELARTLLQSGARSVEVWALARTGSD